MHGQTTDADWRIWLEEHSAKLWLFARQKVRLEADAEDLMQEAIIEAAKKSNGLPAPSMVFGIIHRRAIDWARREHRRVAREGTVIDDAPVAWFDVSSEQRERVQLIQQALTKLPENQREVITLKIWGDLTFSEIAAALGIPANTAASQYRYALESLRQLTKEVLA